MSSSVWVCLFVSRGMVRFGPGAEPSIKTAAELTSPGVPSLAVAWLAGRALGAACEQRGGGGALRQKMREDQNSCTMHSFQEAGNISAAMQRRRAASQTAARTLARPASAAAPVFACREGLHVAPAVHVARAERRWLVDRRHAP